MESFHFEHEKHVLVTAASTWKLFIHANQLPEVLEYAPGALFLKTNICMGAIREGSLSNSAVDLW